MTKQRLKPSFSLRISAKDASRELGDLRQHGEGLLGRGDEVSTSSAYRQWEQSWREWVAEGQVALKRIAHGSASAEAFRRAASRSTAPVSSGWKDELSIGTSLVESGIKLLDEYASHINGQASRTEPTASPRRTTGLSVFIVHGHDETWKQTIARALERAQGAGVNVVILHERPNAGQLLLEKFESNARASTAAVVILSADDFGSSKKKNGSPAKLRKRARQNVVFELGFLAGSLGRDRVVTLYERGVELPSDLEGLAYIELDRRGQWREELIRELRAGGLDFDANRLLPVTQLRPFQPDADSQP